MRQIDWSKAPADATHYHPKAGGYREHWIKPGFFCVTGFEGKGWVPDLGHPAMKLAVSRPITWNGEGLPPVGLEVETVFRGTVRQVKILAITDQNIFMRQIEGDREWLWNRQRAGARFERTFRPIRTAEQIAAEERENAVEDMRRTVSESDRFLVSELEALYDAGYRKVEQ